MFNIEYYKYFTVKKLNLNMYKDFNSSFKIIKYMRLKNYFQEHH
jgi:hypothetical protein